MGSPREWEKVGGLVVLEDDGECDVTIFVLVE